jgi:hypothetical protein
MALPVHHGISREHQMHASDYAETPFDTLRAAFEALAAEPCPLSIPARELAGLIVPARDVALPEIKRAVWDKSARPAVKRALWAAVVRRAQAGDASWTLAAAGLAYPALAGKVLRACQANPADIHELQAEVLVEFLTALGQLDMDDPRVVDVAGWLAWRAFFASRAFRRAEAAAAAAGSVPLAHGTMPLFPAGHPDVVLARAVRAGVIDRDEADWIGRTCLEQEDPKAVAREYGIALSTFYRRRLEAGRKLAAAIESGDLPSL